MEIKENEIQSKAIKVEIIEDEKVVGRAFLYLIHNDLHDEPYGFMEDVYVDESFRGQGYGKILVNKIIDLARDNSCYKLIATSRHERGQVHELYKKLGFVEYGVEFRYDF